jgi:hypothetical protein
VQDTRSLFLNLKFREVELCHCSQIVVRAILPYEVTIDNVFGVGLNLLRSCVQFSVVFEVYLHILTTDFFVFVYVLLPRAVR